MLIDPPIDKLVEKVGCKYALVRLVSERARFLEDKKAELLEEKSENAITFAAREVYDGKIVACYDN